MRIRELRLIRYGKFTDRMLAFPPRDQDIHLIVGPNEAGKSTVRTAIGDWLFGIPMRTPLAFLHPMPEMRLGGIIEARAEGERAARTLAFDRTKGNRQTLRAPEDQVLSDLALQPWLGSLQAQAFQRMHALDHATLVQGGAGILSASDDLGRMLFQSAAGIGHLGEVLQELDKDAADLWAPRRAAARSYYKALDELERAQADFREANLQTRAWKDLQDAVAQLDRELSQTRALHLEVRQDIHRLERIRRVRPLLLELDSALASREALLAEGAVPTLPVDAVSVLSNAQRELTEVESRQQWLRRDIERIELERAAVPVDEPLLALAAEITELNERRLQYRAHRTDIVRRTEEVRQEWLRVEAWATGLGWSSASEEAVRARLPALPVRTRLQRLLRDRGALAEAVRAAQAQLAAREERLRRARDDLTQLAKETGVPPELAAALDDALRVGDQAAAAAERSRQLEIVGAQLERDGAALGSWRADPEALRRMIVPEPALVQSLIERQRQDAADLQSLADSRSARARQLQRLELELAQLVRDHEPVSREQVREARGRRDAAWQSIRAAPAQLHERAPGFELTVLEADQLADARLERAQHEAERASKVQQLQQLELELQQIAQQMETLGSQAGARDAHWASLVESCGLPRLPLEVAPAWLQQRQRVLDGVDRQAGLLHDQRIADERAMRLRNALWQRLMGPDLIEPPPELAECLRRARALISRADQARGERARLEQQIVDDEASLVGLQAQLHAAQASHQAWTDSWQDAMTAAAYPPGVAADQVDSEIDTMAQIDAALVSIRRTRSERIEAMQADLDALEAMARQVAGRLAPGPAAASSDELILDCKRRLDAATQARHRQGELIEQRTRASEAFDRLQQRAFSAQAALAPLMSAAGVGTVEALSAAIERSDRARGIDARIAAASDAIREASDGIELAILRGEVATLGPDEVQARSERLAEDERQYAGQIEVLNQRHGSARSAFEALNGADVAARAEARRQEAIAAMADAAESYLRLSTAARLLRWSIERFRQTQQGPMLAKASAIFRRLTGGSFDRLVVDSEESAPRLFGIRPDRQQVGVGGLSEGTRDQLYLALRLAALELQAEQAPLLPLIADDLFINFDDARTSAGLQALGELSRRMQVIYLTHHEHLVPLAMRVLGDDLNVVRL